MDTGRQIRKANKKKNETKQNKTKQEMRKILPRGYIRILYVKKKEKNITHETTITTEILFYMT